MANYLTAETLIASVKNRAMIPENQATFTTDNFLQLANDELIIGLVPSVLIYHEDYLLYSQEVELVPNKSAYKIPYRSIGNKLRDLTYKDTSDNIYHMARCQIEQVPEFQGRGFVNNAFTHYYVKNNEIVIVPSVGESVTGSLVFSYYIRPNNLVSADRTATITNINTITGEVIVDSIPEDFSTSTKMDFIKVENPFKTLSFDKIPVAIDTTAKVLTFTTPLELTGDITNTLNTIDNPSDITDLVVGQVITGTGIPAATTITAITSTQLTISNAATATTVGLDIEVALSDLHEDLDTGDNINFASETNIVQLPADLHVVLAQRTATRCLEALGDTQGITNANQKLADMDAKIPSLIDNRVESSPIKITNRWGMARISTLRRGRWWW